LYVCVPIAELLMVMYFSLNLYTGVATAFAARDVLGNVFSGLSMQFSKPFSIGDTIKVRGFKRLDRISKTKLEVFLEMQTNAHSHTIL
jgi:acyl dehydratase